MSSNFIQSGNQSYLENFLESTGVEELEFEVDSELEDAGLFLVVGGLSEQARAELKFYQENHTEYSSLSVEAKDFIGYGEKDMWGLALNLDP